MSALISFTCRCGVQLAAAAEHAGMQVQCPRCGKVTAVPQPEPEFEYADDTPDDPPRARVRAKPIATASPPKPPAPPPAPVKKKPVLVDEEDDPPQKKKKARLVDEEKPKKKKKASRRGGEPLSGHAAMYMEKANADLDEEEERHRREGGGIHFTPGIIGGSIAFLVGSILLVICFVICGFNLYVLSACGVLALGGLVRAVLSYMGQGVD